MITKAIEKKNMETQKPLGLILFLAWFIPGAGHLILGRRWKGILFFLTLSIMFIIGLFLKGIIFVPANGELQEVIISIVGTTADLGIGLFYLLSLLFYPISGEITYRYYEIGMLYLLIPGILNYLLVVDVLDIYKGRKS